MTIKILKLLTILFLIIVLISNPVSSQSDVDAILYQSSLDAVKMDGVIDTDEYATTLVLPNGADNTLFVELSWSHNGTHLAIGLSGKLTGWIGFGQNSEGNGMIGSNMIISSVSNNEITIGDYFAVGNSEPTKDENQLANFDESNSAGSDDGTTTIIEFIIPMASDDVAGQDKSWIVGESYNFFVSAQESSDTLIYHTWHTNVLSVEISSEAPPEVRYITVGAKMNYDSNPIANVTLALILFSVIAIFIKQNRNVNVL